MTFDQFEKKYIANVVKSYKEDFENYRGKIGALDIVLSCEYCPFANQCDVYEFDCSKYLTDHIDEM